ncbi:MAG TPA: peptidase, partial [Psychromonas sp.]
CSGFTNALYCTTTEVYPDSPNMTGEDCINAQVAAITAGLDYLIISNIV